MDTKMRHCALENKSKTCVCLICSNDRCISYYGKLCDLCSTLSPDQIISFDYSNTECLNFYSWSDKLKGKKIWMDKLEVTHHLIDE